MGLLVDRMRRAGAHPAFEPAVAVALRAWVTRSPVAFMARELLGVTGCYRYELRMFPGRSVLVRHGTGDVVTLGEVFHDFDYRPPPGAERVIAMRPGLRVVDLGANVGYAGAFFSGLWPGSTIRGWEPDPENAQVHERLIEVDGDSDRWSLRRAAAGAEDGEAEFVAGEVALSHLADLGHADARGRTVTVAVDDVLDDLAAADLLKMDIEGGEWEILADPRFAEAALGCVVMEYHPEGCPGEHPARTVRELLEAARFQVDVLDESDDGAGMVWAWREH